jgi:hypothetical protein
MEEEEYPYVPASEGKGERETARRLNLSWSLFARASR